jgi:hypothetical protein
MSMVLIESKTIDVATSTIEFTSIPQDGTDLYILASGRTSANQAGDNIIVRPNGSTTGLTCYRLYGDGTNRVSDSVPYWVLGNITGNTATANTFGNASMTITNYASTTTNKAMSCDGVMENNASFSYQNLAAGLWASNLAISSLTLLNAETGANFLPGTRVYLYKITKGSDGIVTVS